MTAAPTAPRGLLDGLRVVELASAHAAYAGKLFGDLGADVIVVEPPGGHESRSYEPFLDDEPGPERSLYWWHYNTSKRSVVVDLDTEAGRAHFGALCAGADIVLEGETPGRLAALGIDHDVVRGARPALIWVSLTAFGRTSSRALEPFTDLTLLAGGGPVWSCGYDDHSIPPVRGAGNQAYNIGSLWAVMAALTAVLHRDISGEGQYADVSMFAAANVTTESATIEWLVGQATVSRQTGRHAVTVISQETQVRCRDGRYVTTGFPPRHAKDFVAVRDWIDELGHREHFDEIVLLDLAVEQGGIELHKIREDPLVGEIYGAGRTALVFLAEHLSAEEFFLGAQTRGIAVGAVLSPEEAMFSEQFVSRGFPVAVEHDDLSRRVTYPGAPFIAASAPWRIARRAPHIGEHQDDVLGHEILDEG